MSDTESPDVVTLLDRVDGVRRGLIGLLETGDGTSYATRPASGEWSVVENVRHLLFAEQLHLGKFVPEAGAFSKLGLTPHFARDAEAFADVGTEPSDDLNSVLLEWDAIHKAVLDAVVDSAEAKPKDVQDHLDHLLYHFKIIKDLLAEQENAA